MDFANQNEGKMTEIGRSEKMLLGEMVVYSLLVRNHEGQKQYAAAIAKGAERESCFLGNDLFSAVAFFRKIVEGEVFPYSLSEIVEDYWQEMKNRNDESA